MNSSALLAAGFPVKGILGEERNIKQRSPRIWPILPRRTVVGQGFDVHRYDENRPRPVLRNLRMRSVFLDTAMRMFCFML